MNPGARRVVEIAVRIAVIAASLAFVWSVIEPRLPSAAGSPAPALSRLARPIPIRPPENAAIAWKTADITIVEFADFECPFCGKYASILSELRSANSVGVAIDFRHFPITQIHPLAMSAAVAANCSKAQGRFWEMHDALFASPQAVEQRSIRSAALTLGLDIKRFDSCLAANDRASIDEDVEEGKRLGVRSTPTLIFAKRRSDGSLQAVATIVGLRSRVVVERAVRELRADR